MRRTNLALAPCQSFIRFLPIAVVFLPLLLLAVPGEALGPRQPTESESHRTGVVIVRFAEEDAPNGEGMNLAVGVFGSEAVDDLLEEYEVDRIEQLLPSSLTMNTEAGRRLQRTFAVYYDDETDPSELVESLEMLEDIELARVDRYVDVMFTGETRSVPVDTYFPEQWSLDYYRDSVDVDMPEAWAIERGDPDLVLGVIDLGTMVDTSGGTWKLHSEFRHYFTQEDNSPTFTLSASDFDLDDAADDDALSYEDNVFGRNFFSTNTSETNPYRTAFWKNTPVNWNRVSGWSISGYHMHGVHVAGIAIAKARFSSTPPGNIAGIANRCQGYFVSHQPSSTELIETQAIIAVSDFASVINMSSGWCEEPDEFDTRRDAVAYAISEKDIVFVAAVGNISSLGGGCEEEVISPARWDGVLAVGNMDSTLSLYFDSLYGPEIGFVDIVAPVGAGVTATSHTQCDPVEDPHPCAITETVETFGGTSAAAPHVAGIAMLVRSRFPALDQEQVRERILRAAEYYWTASATDQKKYGTGKVNAYRALTEWGTIETNTTWGSVAGMPDTLYVAGDLTVAEGVKLTIHSGAVIRIAPSDILSTGVDDERIEINIDGELEVHGSVGDPVIIEAWDPQGTDDWVGIYVSGSADSVSFQNCIIRNADIAIDSYAPLKLRNVTIEDVQDAAVSVWSTTLKVDVSTIGASDADGIRLDDSAATIDSTAVNGPADYGLYMSGSVVRFDVTRFVRDWANTDSRAFVVGAISEDNDTVLELGTVGSWPNGTKARLIIEYLDRDGTSAASQD